MSILKKILDYFYLDRKYVVYFLLVFITAIVLLFTEWTIIHSFRKTSRVVLNQYESRIYEYKSSLGLEKEEIEQLASLIQADSTKYQLLEHFLKSKGEKKGGYTAEEAIHLLEESKAVLEYQMSLVKTEYEALQIWVAVITIVFLVFSFYAFYRMDRMSENGAAIINNLKTEGAKAKEEFDKSKETNRQEIDGQKALLQTAIDEKMTSALSQLEANKQEIDGQKRMLQTAIDEKMANALSQFDKKYQEITAERNKLIQSFEKIKDSVNQTMESLGDMPAPNSEILISIKEIQEQIAMIQNSIENIGAISKKVSEIELTVEDMNRLHGQDVVLQMSYKMDILDRKIKALEGIRDIPSGKDLA